MIFHADAAPLVHGGDLGAARRMFPGAPEPFIDLSTGINPHPYPVPQLPPDTFARLPQSAAIYRLAGIAAETYGAPSAEHVAAAPGTQILLPQVAALAPPGRAAVLGPTYGELARAAIIAGHEVEEVTGLENLRNTDLAMIVHPNNPDGRRFEKNDLLELAGVLHARNGWLVVDEAFMDAGPADASLSGDVGQGNIVVLRSFGKFYGLAGLRLGFALTAPPIAARLRALLGPWAVSGPAIAVGEIALADTGWAVATRAALAQAARRLDDLLTGAGLEVIGGTPLFRLARTEAAKNIFVHFGRAGILVRAFAGQPRWLRFGLPGGETEWRRLSAALASAPQRP